MREPTEVWVLIPPENPRLQWPMQFFGSEGIANAIAAEHLRLGVDSRVKRYTLTTPAARRVVEAAVAEIRAADRVQEVCDHQIRFATRRAYERALDTAERQVTAAREERRTAVRALAAKTPVIDEGIDPATGGYWLTHTTQPDAQGGA